MREERNSAELAEIVSWVLSENGFPKVRESASGSTSAFSFCWSDMTRSPQPECQLGDRLFRKVFVHREPQFFAAEAGQLGEQRGGIDFDHELAGTEGHHLAMLALVFGKDLVEGLAKPVALPTLTGFGQDRLEEVTSSFGFGQVQGPRRR